MKNTPFTEEHLIEAKVAQYNPETGESRTNKKMIIQLGKRYIREDKEITGNLERSDNKDYPFYDSRFNHLYTETGECFQNNRLHYPLFDIKEQYFHEETLKGVLERLSKLEKTVKEQNALVQNFLSK